MNTNFFFFFEKNIEFLSYNNKYITKTNNNTIKNIKTNNNTILYSIISLLNKSGLFKKKLIIFFKIIPLLSKSLNKNDIVSNEIKYNFSSMCKYNNFNFLLFWALSTITVTFNINAKMVPKKYKKKNKDKYIFNVKYIFKKNRNKLSLSTLRKYYYQQNKDIKTNIFKIIFDIIFNYKNSIIYLNKLKIYNKLIK